MSIDQLMGKKQLVAHNRTRSLFLLALLTVVANTGCARLPYSFGTSDRYHTSQELAAITDRQIERGKPQPVIDTLGWIWGIPSKIMLFDRRIENHNIDNRTESAVATYLQQNDLGTVKVRVNQYHPGDDWRRLAANKAVGPGWRYTLGTLSVLGETLVPGRVFGGDHYNPFTNTIHLYSNVPAVALHEAGHARDFAERKWKGTYAAAYLLPIAPLYHESKATNEALGYIATTGTVDDQKEAVHILYPAYGSYVGNAISGAVPLGYAAGIIGGHVAGRVKGRMIGQQHESEHQIMQAAANGDSIEGTVKPAVAEVLKQ